jgi:tetratricopeptide (TPR) repeat protein
MDPVAAFRDQLRDLFVQARRPTYRSLETHADEDGLSLRRSTVSNLLNGPGTPRWDTVETFIRACVRYAKARQIRLAPDLIDLDRWHREYRAMENVLADRAAHRERVAGRPVPVRRRRLAIPAELPSDIATFTGRTQHLADLDKLLPSHEPAPDPHGRATAVVISAIDGTAGVGKTALAVHWAHQVRDRFPDGQLYVNLRGFDPGGQVMDPAVAVRRFLDALEVPPQRIPGDRDAQAALYRSLLVDKRMLIVLDNARDSAQVRPLLPGTPGCLVVVTSRNQLTSLVAATGAYPLTLDLLTRDEAHDLLAHRLGTERIAAEPDAIDEIITRCARLPLALALVAAHATLHPHTRLQFLAGQLRNAQQRWQTLSGDDPTTDVQALFSWSYRSLTRPAARLFRLLGLHPGPDIGAPATASLTALPVEQVRPLLAELVRAHLITEPTRGRYTLHDLLRAYAAELAGQVDDEPDRRATVHRILDHYLYTGHAADQLLDPHRDPLTLNPPKPGVSPEFLDDHEQALGWFANEHSVLFSVINLAVTEGLDTHTSQLAWVLWTFLDRRGNRRDWEIIQQAVMAAAERLTDPTAQAHARRLLAVAYTRSGRFDEAYAQLRDALGLCRQTGDRTGQARIHLSLAVARSRQGHYADALHHARQGLDLYQDSDHRSGQANALNAVGWYFAQLGDYRCALTYCQQALSLHEDLSDRLGEANTWDSLGYAHHHLGHHAQAVTCYQHALDLSRDIGDRYYEADNLIHLGDTHHDAGNPTAARDAYQQALIILEDLDHPDAAQVRAKLTGLDPPTDETTG